VIPVGDGLEPLDEFTSVRSSRLAEAEEITLKAHELGFEGIDWCGGVYSHEWGFASCCIGSANPKKRPQFVTALEHCDMVAATCAGSKLCRVEAKRLRHGPQVDVESKGPGLPRRVSGRGRSAVRRSARETWRRLSDQQSSAGIFLPSGLRR